MSGPLKLPERRSTGASASSSAGGDAYGTLDDDTHSEVAAPPLSLPARRGAGRPQQPPQQQEQQPQPQPQQPQQQELEQEQPQPQPQRLLQRQKELDEIARLEAELASVRCSEPEPVRVAVREPEPEPELEVVDPLPRRGRGSGPEEPAVTLPSRNRRGPGKPPRSAQPVDWSELDQPDHTDMSLRPLLPSKGDRFTGFRPNQSSAIYSAVMERPGTTPWMKKQLGTGADPTAAELPPPRMVLADAIEDALNECHKQPEDHEFMLQLCGDAVPVTCTCVCREMDFNKDDEEHPFHMRSIAIAIRRELKLSVTKETEIADNALDIIRKDLQREQILTLTGHDVGGPELGRARDTQDAPASLKEDRLYHLRTRAWEETAPGSGEWKYQNGVASVVQCPLRPELFTKLHPVRQVRMQPHVQRHDLAHALTSLAARSRCVCVCVCFPHNHSFVVLYLAPGTSTSWI
jgi:hypothetical protein